MEWLILALSLLIFIAGFGVFGKSTSTVLSDTVSAMLMGLATILIIGGAVGACMALSQMFGGM